MNDTHPEAERVQIELLRKMSPDRRAAMASSLRNRTYRMARRAIAEAHPDWPALEQKLYFIELHYGADLARRARAYWQVPGAAHA